MDESERAHPELGHGESHYLVARALAMLVVSVGSSRLDVGHTAWDEARQGCAVRGGLYLVCLNGLSLVCIIIILVETRVRLVSEWESGTETRVRPTWFACGALRLTLQIPMH